MTRELRKGHNQNRRPTEKIAREQSKRTQKTLHTSQFSENWSGVQSKAVRTVHTPAGIGVPLPWIIGVVASKEVHEEGLVADGGDGQRIPRILAYSYDSKEGEKVGGDRKRMTGGAIWPTRQSLCEGKGVGCGQVRLVLA